MSAQVVRTLNMRALILHRKNKAEYRRRRQVSAAPLKRLADLDTLLGLPVAMPLPLLSLGDSERKRVHKLPSGSVSFEQGCVVRRAVKPVEVKLAIVAAAQPRRGLEQASRFAPFCSRAVLLHQPAPRMDDFLNEASFYGIGVLLHREDGVEELLEADPYRPARHTAGAWGFVEDLYQELS
ncbi:hypothetical protein GCM10009642_36950 [Nocardiopsis metallicus]